MRNTSKSNLYGESEIENEDDTVIITKSDSEIEKQHKIGENIKLKPKKPIMREDKIIQFIKNIDCIVRGCTKGKSSLISICYHFKNLPNIKKKFRYEEHIENKYEKFLGLLFRGYIEYDELFFILIKKEIFEYVMINLEINDIGIIISGTKKHTRAVFHDQYFVIDTGKIYYTEFNNNNITIRTVHQHPKVMRKWKNIISKFDMKEFCDVTIICV